MGFKEIAMIVVSLILAGILALNIAPSISASGNATKAGVLASETGSIAAAAKMWMANNSTDATFTGINVTNVAPGIPNLTVASSKFQSKVLSTIEYSIAVNGSNTAAFDITITGLSGIAGAETSLLTQLAKLGTVTDATAGDGTLVVTILG